VLGEDYMGRLQGKRGLGEYSGMIQVRAFCSAPLLCNDHASV